MFNAALDFWIEYNSAFTLDITAHRVGSHHIFGSTRAIYSAFFNNICSVD